MARAPELIPSKPVRNDPKDRRRLGLLVRAFALLLAVMVTNSGCKPEIPTSPTNLPKVAGEWSYTASGIRVVGRPPGASCSIAGVTLIFGPWRDTGFFGRSEGGSMTCTGDLQAFSMDLPPYAVRNGGAVLNFIAFDIGAANWRHDGTIVGDTMSGRLVLTHPDLRLEGTFRAVLRRSAGGSTVAAAQLSPSER